MRIRLLWVFMIAISSAGAGEAPATVKVFNDIPYVKDENPRHRLDLYVPDGKSDCPVFLFSHGGAWRTGDKSLYQNIGRTFAAAGVVTAIINYRLGPGVRHPAHVEDCAYAFGWLSGNVAQYGGDPRKIFVGGHSAGGHMTSLLALDPKYLKAVGRTPADIRGCIVLDGVALDLDRAAQRLPSLVDMYEAAIGPRTNWPDASPMNHITGKHPPFLVLIGAKDDWIPHEDTKEFVQLLKMKGSPVEYGVVEDQEHFPMVTGIGQPEHPVAGRILEFISRHSPKP